MAAESLVSSLFPKSRRMILGLLIGQPDRALYLREIAQLAHLGVGQVQRELDRLVNAGIVRRFKQGRHVYFQANPDCPVFDELRGIVVKTIGVADVLGQVLLPLRERIHVAFIYGSVARREERSSSDVDLLVIGEVSLADVVDVIRDAEQSLGRPVNPTVYPRAEFSAKLKAGQHFVTKVAEGEKLILIGDERDVAAIFGE